LELGHLSEGQERVATWFPHLHHVSHLVHVIGSAISSHNGIFEILLTRMEVL